jgi:hypothetical protein
MVLELTEITRSGVPVVLLSPFLSSRGSAKNCTFASMRLFCE